MIATTAYILISTISIYTTIGAEYTQTTAIFADKQSCESAATTQDFAYKNLHTGAKWNLTCHPYQIGEVKK